MPMPNIHGYLRPSIGDEIPPDIGREPVSLLPEQRGPQPVSSVNYQPVQPYEFEVVIKGRVLAANAMHARKLIENGGVSTGLALHVESAAVAIVEPKE